MVAPDPIVGTAVGAAVAFYSLRAAVSSSDVRPSILLMALCVAAALFVSSVSLIAIRSSLRSARSTARFALAFCVGLVIGVAAADRPASRAYWGMAQPEVRGAVARVVSDPRAVKGGGVLAEIEPESAETAAGVRTSARGRIAAVFSAYALKNGTSVERGRLVRLTGKVVQGRFGPLFKADSIALAREAPMIERARSSARAGILRRLDGKSWGGLAGALLLGSKDDLDSGENEAYAAAGCAHVLALSGMHLALIAALIAFFLKPLLGLKRSTLFGFLLIVAYVYLAGAQASLVRAALMYAAAAAGVVFDLPRRTICLLSAAFLIQLAVDPESARGMSFVLSYLALAGLCLFTGAADDLFRAWIPDFLRPALAASFGAFLATAAVSAAAFGVLRPVGLVASLVLTPAANALMIGGMAYLALSSAHPALGLPFDAFLSVVGGFNERAVEFASRCPGLPVGSARPVLVCSLAVAVFLVYGRFLRNHRRNRFEPIT